MRSLTMENLEVLNQEELLSLDGGVWDPTSIPTNDGDYGINSPGGCIPNPFDKILKGKTTIGF